MPSGGSPSAGSMGIPASGWGSGLPSSALDGPGAGFHANFKQTFFQQNFNGPDRTRSTHDLGDHRRSDGQMTYERSLKDGVQMRAQSSLRYTEDREVLGTDGNRFRLEGQFLELGRPSDFLVRIGDVVPQFSNYSFAKSGDGLLALKNFERKDGVIQFQVFAARTAREKDPGTFERHSAGFRGARVWKVKGGHHVGLGGSRVLVRDDLGTIAPEAAATLTGFPRDEINSANYFVDTRQGVHFEGELARSVAESQLGTATPTLRNGTARRQAIGYTRSGKNITFEHERIDPTFDALDASATVDIDRQSVFTSLPLSPRFTITAFGQRVYNDVDNTIGRSGQNKTVNVALTSQPFATPHFEKNRYLKNLNLGVTGTFSKSTATDASTDRFDREYTYTISNRVNRLTGSYSLRAADNVDFVTVDNARAPNHSSYQLGYDIPGGRQDYWKLSPFVSLGHDHDLIVPTGIIDTSNESSMGINGNYGPRSTFSLRREERIQRTRSASRLALVETWNGEWNYQLQAKNDLRAQLLYISQDNADSSQAGFKEDKTLFSIFRNF